MALDLDGTLLDPAGRLSTASLRVLRHLAGLGVRIALATGRMTSGARPIAEALGLPLALVTYNGAVVLEGGPSAWSILVTRTLPEAARDAVFELSRAHGAFLNVYSRGRLHGYHRDGDFAWSRHYEANAGSVYVQKTASLDELPREGLEKLLVICDPESRDRLRGAWAPRLAGLCDLTTSNPEYLEFLAKGVSKGSTLQGWLAKAGLGPQDLIAFGDGENDLEMLRMAGCGLAMANAVPGLRDAYGRLSRWSHAEDGVARELCALFGMDYPSYASAPG